MAHALLSPADMKSSGPIITSGARFGRYRIGPLIASGPRTRLFLAEQIHCARKESEAKRSAGRAVRRIGEPAYCVLKVLRPEQSGDQTARRHLQREAAMLRALKHPTIEPLLEVGAAGDDLFYAVSLTPGASLRELESLVHPASWTSTAIIDLALALFEALTFAHALGHPHGSLASDHVRIGSDGRIALWGFGLPALVCFGAYHEKIAPDDPGSDFASDVGAAGRLVHHLSSTTAAVVPRDLVRLLRAAMGPTLKDRPTAGEALGLVRAIDAREARRPLGALLDRGPRPAESERTMVIRRSRREEKTVIIPPPRGESMTKTLAAVILFGLLLGLWLTNRLPLA